MNSTLLLFFLQIPNVPSPSTNPTIYHREILNLVVDKIHKHIWYIPIHQIFAADVNNHLS